jgi:hypothetical protein
MGIKYIGENTGIAPEGSRSTAGEGRGRGGTWETLEVEDRDIMFSEEQNSLPVPELGR